MKYLRLFVFLLLVWLASAQNFLGDLPTIPNVCHLQGDWCSTRCQIAGGRDGICNPGGLCTCRPL
ncbi:uncharacterized protein LOC117892476 [Drosophila subobscura]|uniref:uncharacterized protein LOC117892476 n=1 Tax=Drosophila subobscura TaxID=7241 RepID=UPI00155B2194|nr:uncharacterized protein LOC117892476 [Drosophila subobscura]